MHEKYSKIKTKNIYTNIVIVRETNINRCQCIIIILTNVVEIINYCKKKSKRSFEIVWAYGFVLISPEQQLGIIRIDYKGTR